MSVEEVTLRSAQSSRSFLVMRAESSSDSRYDDYEGPNTTIELALDGLHATAILPAYAMPALEMVALFREIDRDWRGWLGRKTVGDPDKDWLVVAAEYDGKGHVATTVSLSDGWPMARLWTARLTVRIDVGTALEIAAAIEQWALRVWPAGWANRP